MTEYEILDLLNSTGDSLTQIAQWWISVAFGVVAVAHFASKKLNIFLVALIILMYGIFAWMQIDLGALVNSRQDSYREALNALQGQGIELSPAGLREIQIIQFTMVDRMRYPLLFLGLFLGPPAYLVYAYWHAKQQRAK